MNKGELVEAIASDANLSKTDAESAFNAFIGSVQSAVADGDKVTLPGFGTFSPSARKARTGMNPQTREPIQIPAAQERQVLRGLGIQEPRYKGPDRVGRGVALPRVPSDLRSSNFPE